MLARCGRVLYKSNDGDLAGVVESGVKWHLSLFLSVRGSDSRPRDETWITGGLTYLKPSGQWEGWCIGTRLSPVCLHHGLELDDTKWDGKLNPSGPMCLHVHPPLHWSWNHSEVRKGVKLRSCKDITESSVFLSPVVAIPEIHVYTSPTEYLSILNCTIHLTRLSWVKLTGSYELQNCPD